MVPSDSTDAESPVSAWQYATSGSSSSPMANAADARLRDRSAVKPVAMVRTRFRHR